ncbi:probable serine/threonine-protein kinase samkC isoform X1 [Lampris incognitus]|uniref:probable serine/threonine-protein kinase samkC isoform X1 n=1 Tax=Lampris incognitus TaxID=2546036 RepID=UPI0024B603E1|nr:probable serine/threonine-protein kinase samkC isoform X1 [Lampris incognitus]
MFRTVLLLWSVSVLLVEGDLDINDGAVQAMFTDKDSTSDEAPTEGMNAISPDQSDTSSTSVEAGQDAANHIPGPDVTVGSSAEEDENEHPDSEEDESQTFTSRLANTKPGAQHPQPPNLQPSQPKPVLPQPVMPQPIVPQPRVAAVRSRASSKRRSRTGRRQM